MTIVDSPDTESPPLEDLDGGVIEEARARQRRYRASAVTVAFVAAGIAGILIVVGGGSSGGAHATRGPAHAQPRPVANASATLAVCSPRPGTKAIDEGTPSRSLLSILGVLRRPATPADALPATWFYAFTSGAVAHIQGGDVFVKYVRRARVIGDGSYYLIPSLYTDCGGYKITGEGVTILQTNSNSGSGGRDNDATRIKQGKAYGFDDSFTHTTVTMLIPDGVTSVTLHYPAGEVGGPNDGHAPAFTITARVIQNLLVAPVPRSDSRIMAPMTMTWRAANGHILKTFNSL